MTVAVDAFMSSAWCGWRSTLGDEPEGDRLAVVYDDAIVFADAAFEDYESRWTHVPGYAVDAWTRTAPVFYDGSGPLTKRESELAERLRTPPHEQAQPLVPVVRSRYFDEWSVRRRGYIAGLALKGGGAMLLCHVANVLDLGAETLRLMALQDDIVAWRGRAGETWGTTVQDVDEAFERVERFQSTQSRLRFLERRGLWSAWRTEHGL